MNIVGPKVILKHIARIEGASTADGESLTWVTPVKFEGIIDLLSGRERLTYQQITVPVAYKVLTNYREVHEEDKVEYNSITYDVVLVENKLMMNKLVVILLSA